MKKDHTKIQIGIRIYPNLLKLLDEQAESERRNRSNMIEVAIEKYLKEVEHGRS